MRVTIRVWFCLAVATLAASLGDAVVESASNRGWFGPGNFTDHSSWVVEPALLLGLFLVALHLSLRIRQALVDALYPAPNWLLLARDNLGPIVVPLIPVIFGVQLVALFTMETAEQFVVSGHTLGGTIWLGGPLVIGLLVHFSVCCLVTLVASLVLRACANATVRFVRRVLSFAALRLRGLQATYIGHQPFVGLGRTLRVACSIGERAPPTLIA